eukprot:1158774-Pelagomonas_calceolata.AAC.5
MRSVLKRKSVTKPSTVWQFREQGQKGTTHQQHVTHSVTQMANPLRGILCYKGTKQPAPTLRAIQVGKVETPKGLQME